MAKFTWAEWAKVARPMLAKVNGQPPSIPRWTASDLVMNRLWPIALAFSALVCGQATATLTGVVRDASQSVVPGATVTLRQSLTQFRRTVQAGPDGTFSFLNLPLQAYTVEAAQAGFNAVDQQVVLRSNVPVAVTLVLALAARAESVQVTANAPVGLIDPEATGTRQSLNQRDIAQMPTPVNNRGLEALLLNFPGFAVNANGAIHPRGAHNQMTYVVDGMPVSDQLTGAFATSLDPNMVDTIELFTGNIPAEYGNKTAAVVNLTTRSGLGRGRPFSGNTEVSAARFETAGQVTQFAGGDARWGYLVSLTTLQSHRYLDQVSVDNLHNGGNAERGFTRFDWHPSPRDQWHVNLMGGRSSFEVANLRSQQAAGQNQRQLLRDASVGVGWLHVLSARSTFDVNASYRTAIAQLFGSAGDRPVTADQARHLSTINTGAHGNAVRGRHTLRAGADYQRFPVSENFFFAVTDPAFNDPTSADYLATLQAFDLTRGGQRFLYHGKQAGNLASAFVQDTVRWSRLTASLGLRYDFYRFLVRGTQWQPRVGLAYAITETGTVLRASYNRLFQLPPNENLLLSNSDESRALVPPERRALLGNALRRIRPERQNVYEAGLQQALGRRASLNLSYYHKDAQDQQDNDNFLNTGVIFPTSLASIRVNGLDARVTFAETRGVSGALSITHSRSVSTPPFTGGLFLGTGAIALLSAGPFVIDHDQALGLQGNIRYGNRRGWWTSATVRYDSGLVANPSDPAVVAADADYADLLPYVNLESNPPRVRPRTILDVAAGYERTRDERRRWDVVAQVSNVTNETALYNFQSVFVGTRLVAPRTWGAKARWYW